MTDATRQPPEHDQDWGRRDSAAGYELYLALCREEMRQGKPLPPMFARRRPDERGQVS